MNHYPNREQVQALRERYPPGTLIQLTADMHGERFQAGDIGKVTVVDDIGQIHMAWEKGGSLALIPGVDSFREIFTEPLELKLRHYKLRQQRNDHHQRCERRQHTDRPAAPCRRGFRALGKIVFLIKVLPIF